MEKERQVRMADMRQEVQRNLDDRAGGAKAALRRQLAGRSLSAQAAMLSPRGKASPPKPATPGTASDTTPAPQAEPPKPAAPVPSAPIPATPVPEAEPPTPVPASEPMAPIPGPPASLTGGARPLLRQGSSGDSVVELQSMLNQRDEVGQHLAVDGLFGPKTAAAVRQFQAAHPPLAVDAVVGPMTWGALDGTGIEPQDATELAKKLFKRGADAYEKGEYAHSYDLLTSAQEHHYDSALVFCRAQCLKRMGGRADEAVALYQQYIAEGGSRSAEAVVFVAELKGPEKTGDKNIDKGPAKEAFQKGAALYEAGDYAHAYDEFTKADRLYHDSALTFSRAQCLRRLGARDPEAIALFEQYVGEGGTRSAEALGYIAELKGPQKTGIEEVDKPAAKAMFKKASALFNAGDYAHAYDELTRCSQLYPDPALTFSRAQCLRNLGARREDAIALFKQYLAEGGGTRSNEAAFYIQELQNQGAISPTKKV